MTRSAESPECVFCAATVTDDGRQLLVHESPLCYVILNLYPYNAGHLLVVPRRHVDSLTALTRDELHEVARLTQVAEQVLMDAFQPQGINVGLNLGRPAGAGIVDHLHVHLVPRWTGDTNFMSIVGEVRVMPEELPRTADKLRPMFGRLGGD